VVRNLLQGLPGGNRDAHDSDRHRLIVPRLGVLGNSIGADAGEFPTGSAWYYRPVMVKWILGMPRRAFRDSSTRSAIMKQASTSLAVALAACALVMPVPAGDLEPETLNAFNHYVSLTEARIEKQISDPNVFLYVNTLPQTRRHQAVAILKQGGVYMTAMNTLTTSGDKITVPDGLVHHWLGAVFIPGASAADVVGVVQDYDHKHDIYPEVVSSHLISREGEHFRAAMRFREHHVITITLDTEHDVTYTEVDPAHWYSRSYSTRVSQVQDAGKPGEHDLPDGQGDGYVWRIDTFWQFLQQDGGVYLEVEAISLSRAVPTGLNWLIKPFITSVPRESLHDTLECTRSAVLKRLQARSQKSEVGNQEPEVRSQESEARSRELESRSGTAYASASIVSQETATLNSAKLTVAAFQLVARGF
jgi:hypothetical protein